MNKYIITQFNNHRLAAYYNNNKPLDLFYYKNEEEGPRLGGIYVGRVDSILPNLNTAFIEIDKGIKAYMALSEESHIIFLNPKKDRSIHVGDLILVQYTKEAIKSKYPTVSCKLEIGNAYCVIKNTDPGTVSISHKIKDKSVQEALRALAQNYVDDTTHILIRTAAATITTECLEASIREQLKIFRTMYRNAFHRVQYSVLYEPIPQWLDDVLRAGLKDEDEILTDTASDYEQLKCFNLPAQILFTQEEFPLIKRYGILQDLRDTFKHTIWLNSGANLVIEVTEALTVIDINTAKAQSVKGNREELFFKINKEAVDEIEHQLRLRNLSGIILIDFINMKSEENQKQLILHLKNVLSTDPVPTRYVDTTKLGLVEVTRLRKRRPLHELIKYNDFNEEAGEEAPYE